MRRDAMVSRRDDAASRSGAPARAGAVARLTDVRSLHARLRPREVADNYFAVDHVVEFGLA